MERYFTTIPFIMDIYFYIFSSGYYLACNYKLGTLSFFSKGFSSAVKVFEWEKFGLLHSFITGPLPCTTINTYFALHIQCVVPEDIHTHPQGRSLEISQGEEGLKSQNF